MHATVSCIPAQSDPKPSPIQSNPINLLPPVLTPFHHDWRRFGGGNRFGFVKLYDGSTSAELQLFIKAEVENFEEAIKGSTGASLCAVGEVVASKVGCLCS